MFHIANTTCFGIFSTGAAKTNLWIENTSFAEIIHEGRDLKCFLAVKGTKFKGLQNQHEVHFSGSTRDHPKNFEKINCFHGFVAQKWLRATKRSTLRTPFFRAKRSKFHRPPVFFCKILFRAHFLCLHLAT